VKTTFLLIAAVLTTASGKADAPGDLGGRLPPGYEIIGHASVVAGRPSRSFEIVALGRKHEDAARQGPQGAPVRPLLIFERKNGHLVPTDRNDHIVMKADEGGQCDPFLDGDATIATKGRYFTVENGVACGEHWTDYITFRLDDRSGGFVFDNERQEDWEFNPSNDPNAEALIRAGPPRLIRDHTGHLTPFAAWRPKR
jgi:hypothetical protein